MLRRYTTWFGIALVTVGILGFIPPVTPDGMLLGIFAVDPLHNVVHLLSGGIALWAGAKSERASQLYFQIFGVIYGLLIVVGLAYGDSPLLGVMAHNWADVWLHVAIAVTALYLGFVYCARHVCGAGAHPAGHT